MTDNKFYVTKERLEELQKELETLKTEKQIEVAERLKRAKEFGDLSENSEYSEAKEEQAQVAGRVFELENMIKNVAIIKKAAGKETVQIGSTFTVKKDGREFRYTLVGSEEAHPAEGKISNESPLGRAFLDKKAGASVMVETPGGKVEYLLVSIE
ncbi:MAG: transcription elongation factor GreA [Candidatus Liptonbacteria bacterium GWC1_60_9]|uniref:Transcription elongation factor GreA n=3 Tax=Candidatus Liptoniibacteriota TaxID=1817909 RepID=A0A1G2CL23_9BACT|nr:MAG: transcription elongation factor GreA [Candidatus Liptonbacteria bacterium GWC1_60_9]OGY98478.1 MAG: transcription elongation factor GreA [Candidatus Liptonbacteria bacterium RIFCSPHIGHO2_12_FULL_60_13]OGZ02049.1 MAG: transcription elongation factor GreA [Candidatus Liptonbacteria bacterium RIFCSPLOWO2_12_FULL_60_15]